MLSIIIDTREQRPWSFPPHLAEVRRGTLRIGDYALDGDGSFAIERKSLDDFLGSISTGWERFQRELWRMEGANYPAKIIIVEGDYRSVCFNLNESGGIDYPDHNHPKLTPQFIIARIATISLMGVSVLFAHSADMAAGLAIAIFIERRRLLSAIDETGTNQRKSSQGFIPKTELGRDRKRNGTEAR